MEFVYAPVAFWRTQPNYQDLLWSPFLVYLFLSPPIMYQPCFMYRACKNCLLLWKVITFFLYKIIKEQLKLNSPNPHVKVFRPHFCQFRHSTLITGGHRESHASTYPSVALQQQSKWTKSSKEWGDANYFKTFCFMKFNNSWNCYLVYGYFLC